MTVSFKGLWRPWKTLHNIYCAVTFHWLCPYGPLSVGHQMLSQMLGSNVFVNASVWGRITCETRCMCTVVDYWKGLKGHSQQKSVLYNVSSEGQYLQFALCKWAEPDVFTDNEHAWPSCGRHAETNVICGQTPQPLGFVIVWMAELDKRHDRK